MGVLGKIIVGWAVLLLGTQRFRVQEGSVVSYRVHARAFFGAFRHTIQAQNTEVSGAFVVRGDTLSGALRIAAGSFVSGNSRRDRDVAGILRAREHPEILFEVVEISPEALRTLLTQSEGTVEIRGRLTVAGVAREYRFPVVFRWITRDLVQVETEVEARFTDFGIPPPRIRGLGPLGKAITYAPDQVFLSGKILLKREAEP